MVIKVNLRAFTIAQIDELIPAYGESRSEVIDNILLMWFSNNNSAFDYAKQVRLIDTSKV